MYEDDRAPVTLTENHHQLEAKKRTFNKSDCLPFIESTITAGKPERRGKKEQRPRLVRASRDLRAALPDNYASPRNDVGITKLK